MIYERDMADYNLRQMNAKILVKVEFNSTSKNTLKKQQNITNYIDFIENISSDSDESHYSEKRVKSVVATRKKSINKSSGKSYHNYSSETSNSDGDNDSNKHKHSDAVTKFLSSSKKMVLKLHRLQNEDIECLQNQYKKDTEIQLPQRENLNNTTESIDYQPKCLELDTNLSDSNLSNKTSIADNSSSSEIFSKSLVKPKRKRIISNSFSDDDSDKFSDSNMRNSQINSCGTSKDSTAETQKSQLSNRISPNTKLFARERQTSFTSSTLPNENETKSCKQVNQIFVITFLGA